MPCPSVMAETASWLQGRTRWGQRPGNSAGAPGPRTHHRTAATSALSGRSYRSVPGLERPVRDVEHLRAGVPVCLGDVGQRGITEAVPRGGTGRLADSDHRPADRQRGYSIEGDRAAVDNGQTRCNCRFLDGFALVARKAATTGVPQSEAATTDREVSPLGGQGTDDVPVVIPVGWFARIVRHEGCSATGGWEALSRPFDPSRSSSALFLCAGSSQLTAPASRLHSPARRAYYAAANISAAGLTEPRLGKGLATAGPFGANASR